MDGLDNLPEEALFQPDYDEELENVNPRIPGSTMKKGKGRPCNICPGRFTHVRRHVLIKHLPWFVYPKSSCWKCKTQFGQEKLLVWHITEHDQKEEAIFKPNEWKRLVNGLLIELSRRLVGTIDVKELLKYAISFVKDCSGYTFQNEDLLLIKIFCEENGCKYGPKTTEISPDELYSLIHWRILSSLIYQAEGTQELLKLEDKQEFLYPSITLGYSDSHFHLDVLKRRVGYSDSLLGSSAEKTEVPHLEVAIANFCFPRNWPSQKEREELRKDVRIFSTFGIHPRLASLERETQLYHWCNHLENMTCSNDLVAIGECGLDTSDNLASFQFRKQCDIFSRQVEIAKNSGLPLVIHCRGDMKTSKKCLNILNRILPKDHKIHRHCFAGDKEEYLLWKNNFPCCMFGISPLLLRASHHKSLERVISEMPLEDVVLETDAPYLPSDGDRFGFPGQILSIAQEVSKICQIPLTLVLDKTNRNTRCLYGLSD